MSPANKSGTSCAQPDFEVGPHQLVGKPECHAGGQQRPEQAHASAATAPRWDEGKRRRQQQDALNPIAEGSEAKRAAEDKRSQDQSRQTGRDGRSPDFGISAQQNNPRCHFRLGLDRTQVTEVICGAG